jgi:hypothetical protein
VHTELAEIVPPQTSGTNRNLLKGHESKIMKHGGIKSERCDEKWVDEADMPRGDFAFNQSEAIKVGVGTRVYCIW